MKQLVLALAMAVGLAACTSAPEGEPTPSKPTVKSSAPETVPKQLRFTAKTVDGDTFNGTSLAGRNAVLWFWAPWCTECRREAPHVAAAQKANPEVVFVGVAGLGERSAMADFVRDYRVGAFTHLADLDGSLWQRFGVVQQPAYAFIDESGSVEVVRGELGESGLNQRIAALTQG